MSASEAACQLCSAKSLQGSQSPAEIPDEEVGTVAASIAPVAAEPSPSVTGPPEQQSPGELDLLKKLLELLLSFPNRSIAIGVATKALNILQSGKEEDAPETALMEVPTRSSSGQHLNRHVCRWREDAPETAPVGVATRSSSGEHLNRHMSADAESDHSPSWEAASATDADAPGSRRSDGAASESRPERKELASVIDKYPSCKRLTEAYRRVYHMPNKTPLSILFEYASRLNLQLSFEEGQTSQGYFTLTLQLKNDREACLYRPGVGQAKSKKDAKQLAAAALLEVMLDHVPFQDLLYKSDKQQSFKDMQAHRSHPHVIPKGRGNRPGQRHSGGNSAYRGFPGCSPLHTLLGPSCGPHVYPAQGFPGGYGSVQGIGHNLHAQTPNEVPQGGPFDMGFSQDHHLLLARAGSDPTLGFAPHIPRDSGHGNSNSGLNLSEQHMHQGLLCNNLGLPGMQQQPVHSQLPYQHANLDSGLANNMAHFGLGQNPLMDNLQGTHWQDSMMQGDLANTMPLASSAAPLGLPAHHHTMSQGISPLPAAAFNLPWLPENHAMH